MTQINIDIILKTLEQDDFMVPTFIASGHGTVAEVLRQTNELKTILEQKQTILPAMHTRYHKQQAGMSDNVRLVYFIVFGMTHDQIMIVDIMEYLKSCHDLPEETLLSPWHPFLHGMQAIAQITNGEIVVPNSADAQQKLDDFLKKTAAWQAQNK